MKRRIGATVLVVALLVVTGCAGAADDKAAPAAGPTLLPTAVGESTTAQPTQAAEPTVAPSPVSGQATSVPTRSIAVAESEVSSGWLLEDTAVLAEPVTGAESVGQLPAGKLVIVTGEADDWYQIIFVDAPGSHGWLTKTVVGFDSPSRSTGSGSTGVGETAAPAAEPTTPPVASATTTGGTVLGARLNVRSGPGVDNAIIGQFTRDERVEIVDRQSGWLQVRYPEADDGLAWVSAAYVAVDGEPPPVLPTVVRSDLAGTLVFQSRSGGDLYLMNADGSGLQRLTHGLEPSLSPDGTMVAFARWDEPRGLWVKDLASGQERMLLGANLARSPTWTAAADAIVFERLLDSRRCRSTPFGCFTDEEIRQAFGGQDCVDTPMGRFCIGDFPIVSEHFTGLTRVNLSDGSSRDLPASTTARSPDHSRVDDRVLYLDRDGLAVTRSTGNDAPGRLIQLPALLEPAVFSPDGSSFYLVRRSGDQRHIWRFNADGSQGVALTTSDPLGDTSIQNVSPAVSPDGRHVAFLTNRSGPWELWAMNADGSNQRPLAAGALKDISFQYDFSAEQMIDWGP